MSSFLPADWPLYLRYVAIFCLFTLRYLIFAGGAYLVFYIWKKRDWFFMKIQRHHPDRAQVLTEVKYSLGTFIIFGLMILLVSILQKAGYVHIDKGTGIYGRAYFIFATVFSIFFHDTYFYWMHRAVHHPFLFKHVHRIHHLSRDPTPWAAFSFHPIEAVLEIGFLPLLLLLMPLPQFTLLILSLWMIVFNVLGHLGFELFPRHLLQSPVLKWINTSTNHNMHHSYYNCNYGLYFNIWDRLLKTNHRKYEATYEEVTGRRQEGFLKLRAGKDPEAGTDLQTGVSNG